MKANSEASECDFPPIAERSVSEQARILRIQIDDGELERGVDVRYEWDEAACEFKVKKVLIN